MAEDADTTITSGELFRAVTLIRDDIKGLRAEVAERPHKEDLILLRTTLEAQITAAQKAQEMRDKVQDKAIAALESWQIWAFRLGGTGLAAALGGVIFNSTRLN